MAITINITERAEEPPRYGHAWRDDEGTLHATITFGQSWITFGSPADARASAVACIRAAEAMEALPPAQDGGQS